MNPRNKPMLHARLTYMNGVVGFLFSMLMATTVFATSSATSSATSGATPVSAEVHYDITVRLDPVARKIEGRSVITANTPEELTLVIGRRFEVMRGRVDAEPFGPAATMGRMRGWRILGDEKLPRRIEIHWRGELAALDTALDHHQTLGRNDPASGEAGTFLPDSSGWYPFLADKLASYNLTIELPAGQRGIVPGRLVEETETADGYRARFEFPAPTGGIDLMAGPYAVDTRTVRGAGGKPIQLRTYFHSSIADLAPAYLDSVKGYLGLYESWIGEYPFSEFSVVSSPTPTGFGMPTLTYLGVEVLRLPFIRGTSLGHEVLHNWWGNGVYPDYAEGNWSEGLTTFMADYAYKERESAGAARDMRRGWLRDFAALAPGQDKPLTTFTSRLHGATQIVGYNKAAMLFLMLRDMLGQDTFDRALQTFWREQRFRIASWADLRHAFEKASGQNLGPFFDQWLTRPGAPVLRIADAALAKPGSGSHRVTVTLEQAEPVYRLRVPVGIRTAESEEIHVLDLESARQAFTVDVRNRPTEIILDPDLRLFRRLMPDEAPPILRQVMVDHTAETILLPENGEARSAAETLAAKMQNRAPKLAMRADGDNLPAVPLLVIGLADQVDAWLAKHRLPARPDVIKGKGSAQAWTVSRPDGVTLAMVSAADVPSLAALARPLPHYGRQSYVVFDGAKMINRGAWPTRSQVVKLD
ncbi:M1 family metallopeptidase [Nitrosospira sp. Is2]|uniref:M1 family metallopeptidase n=1 Tax=Nitrosospira sp. Is2 TaxID=3080532 RepID=UPI002954103D|nr:M1 family aminopeptidase [Nitrosospira sp. Is2]WON72827.1 M1 family aminopeptidase [Nitrosospira sp. Is2]